MSQLRTIVKAGAATVQVSLPCEAMSGLKWYTPNSNAINPMTKEKVEKKCRDLLKPVLGGDCTQKLKVKE